MPAQARIVKKLQFRKEKRERFSPGRFLRALIIIGFIAVLLFGAFRLFDEWHKKVWLSGSRITVVVAKPDPTIYSYNPASGTLTIIEIPKTTQVEAAGGYGKWLAGSLWQLGEDEGKGGELLVVSIQKAFGLPVDAWIGEQGQVLFEQKKLGFPLALWQAVVTSGTATNLTLFDRLDISLGMSNVGPADRVRVDIVTTGAVKKTELPDGLEAYIPVPDRVRHVFELLRDETVFAEGKTLLVINTTPKQGIAASVARIAGTLGVKVVGTQTATQTVEDCRVVGEKENINTHAARRIAQIFECDTKIEKPSGPAHLELILGQGFAERF